MTRLDQAIAYAKQMVGLPYIWGGDDPIKGFDCSGLVQEILAAIGLPMPEDLTAQGLYDHFHFAKLGVSAAQGLPGALYFYGKSTSQITHVGFGIENALMVEAGGGSSKSIDSESAARLNAYVRIRPYDRRADNVAAILPHYP